MNQLICDFEKKCEEWSQSIDQTGVKIIFNNRLKYQVAEKIKFIVVGDNPGKNEATTGEYFVGDSGLVTRLFFEKFLVTNFDDEVLVLNKTPISTSTTNQLKTIDQNYLRETQFYMANLALKLQESLNVPVIILGFSGCRKKTTNGVTWLDASSTDKNAVGKYFFTKMKELYIGSPFLEKLLILKHFSRNSFFEDFNIINYRHNDMHEVFLVGRTYRAEMVI